MILLGVCLMATTAFAESEKVKEAAPETVEVIIETLEKPENKEFDAVEIADDVMEEGKANREDEPVHQKSKDEKEYPNPVRDMMATFGVLTRLDDDQVSVKGEGNFPEVVCNITDQTYLIDGSDGEILNMGSVRDGRRVTAFYSSKMTRSIPPQSNAYAIVFGDASVGLGKFMKVSRVEPFEDGGEGIVAVNSNRDIEIRIRKEIFEDYKEIKKGDALMVWYSMISMSLPAKTTAEKVVLLPRHEVEEEVQPKVDEAEGNIEAQAETTAEVAEIKE